MCFSGTAHIAFNPPHKIFIAFPVSASKNNLYIISCQFNLGTTCCHFWVFYWLVSGAPTGCCTELKSEISGNYWDIYLYIIFISKSIQKKQKYSKKIYRTVPEKHFFA